MRLARQPRQIGLLRQGDDARLARRGVGEKAGETMLRSSRSARRARRHCPARTADCGAAGEVGGAGAAACAPQRAKASVAPRAAPAC